MSRQQPERRKRRDTGSDDERPAGGDLSGFDRRYESRYGDRGTTARDAASDQHDQDAGGRMPGRAHGGRRSSPHVRRHGNPRGGGQRGEDSVQGVSGRVGRQYGDLHGPRPSESRAEGYHGEEQFAGDAGRSSRDRRYGSRRGHGSQRREDPRTDRGL